MLNLYREAIMQALAIIIADRSLYGIDIDMNKWFTALNRIKV